MGQYKKKTVAIIEFNIEYNHQLTGKEYIEIKRVCALQKRVSL